jgi:beta-glucanase (GH16 family)
MMNRLGCLIVTILFLGISSVFAAVPTGYGLVWSDEFNGTSVDTANWNFDVGNGVNGWGNAEQEYYTNGANFTIDSGYGKLWAKRESMGAQSYTSCRMNTKGKKEFKYGYFEVKIRTAKGNGLWNAFWTLGGNIDTITWPACGEVELYEQRTGSVQHAGTAGDNCFIQTCHYGATYNSLATAVYNAHQTNTSTCLCNAFHTYSILWDSLGITYYFDGTQVWTSPSINMSNNFKSFHQPHFLIANMAVGGNYQAMDGGIIDNGIFPQQMAIDYIRVYQKGVITQANPQEKQNKLENVTLVNQAAATLKVFSLKGELLADLTDNLRAMKTGENAVRKSMSRLARGAYVVRCTDNNITIAEKVVIER